MNFLKPMKRLEDLKVEDFADSPVWTFQSELGGSIDYNVVIPVRQAPFILPDDVAVMVLATCTLACGRALYGIATVNGDPPEILPGVSILVDGEWRALMFPPAPDFVLRTEGPIPFCDALGLELSKAFPLSIETRVSSLKNGLSIRTVIHASA